MAVLAFFEPQIAGLPGNSAPIVTPYIPAQNAAFRRGDFIQIVNTQGAGTLAFPSGGLGALATFAGVNPGQSFQLSSAASTFTVNGVTVSGVASGTAPALTYYVEVTYTAAGAESLTGQEFVINCAPGVVPSINVATANRPAGATSFAVYAGLYPSSEVLQQATINTTATGTAYTLAYPLVNSQGINRSVTNPAGALVGMALNSSMADFYSGTGGSFQVNENSLFGATNAQNPLEPNETFLQYVVKFQNSQVIEMSFAQAWSPQYLGTTTGIALDPVTGFFVASGASSNKLLTIFGAADGVPSIQGGNGDIGKRILVIFNSGIV
jgi:hypothetical protein